MTELERDQTQVEEALSAEELEAGKSELVGEGSALNAPERDPYSYQDRLKFWFGIIG